MGFVRLFWPSSYRICEIGQFQRLKLPGSAFVKAIIVDIDFHLADIQGIDDSLLCDLENDGDYFLSSPEDFIFLAGYQPQVLICLLRTFVSQVFMYLGFGGSIL